jgi:hypothetical protein
MQHTLHVVDGRPTLTTTNPGAKRLVSSDVSNIVVKALAFRTVLAIESIARMLSPNLLIAAAERMLQQRFAAGEMFVAED